MQATKSLYQNLGLPLVVAYILLLAKPIGDELVKRGICEMGNDLCTSGLGLLIFLGAITLIGLLIDGFVSIAGSPIKLSTHVDSEFRDPGRFVASSFLIVCNKGNQEITDCHATLEYAKNLYGGEMIPVELATSERLKWKERHFQMMLVRLKYHQEIKGM